jgi:hypothetical protein
MAHEPLPTLIVEESNNISVGKVEVPTKTSRKSEKINLNKDNNEYNIMEKPFQTKESRSMQIDNISRLNEIEQKQTDFSSSLIEDVNRLNIKMNNTLPNQKPRDCLNSKMSPKKINSSLDYYYNLDKENIYGFSSQTFQNIQINNCHIDETIRYEDDEKDKVSLNIENREDDKSQPKISKESLLDIYGNEYRKFSEISFKNDKVKPLFTQSNESVISFNTSINFNPNIVILDHEIKNSQRLQLQEIIFEETQIRLFSSKILQIDAAGLKDGLRMRRDGFAFFGFVEKDEVRIK